MKKLIIIAFAIIFTGIFSACKKEHAPTEFTEVQSFASKFKRDLGNAD
jgi:hypothetical protein